MSFDIHYYFTDNHMTVKGDNADDFIDSFQYVVEEASFLEDPNRKEIKYDFRHHGPPHHDYLIKAEKQFPDIEFELKGYYYPDEAECGFSEIFLFTNKGFFRCDSSTAGINPECEE